MVLPPRGGGCIICPVITPAAHMFLVATRSCKAHSRSDEETYGNERECWTESPIGGIGSPSLASLSMSGRPIVLTREDLRQVNDSAAFGEAIRAIEWNCLPPLSSPVHRWTAPLTWRWVGTLGRVLLACQYLRGAMRLLHLGHSWSKGDSITDQPISVSH